MASRSSFSESISHPSYASDEQESTYLSKVRTLQWVRFGIALVTLGTAAAVVGCESAPLHRYNETVSFQNLWLPLWPLNLDLRQTNALLACGAVIMFQALIYIIVALVPSPRPRTRLLNSVSSAVALGGLVTAVVGVAFSIHLPSANPPVGFTVSETIHSWTCKWQSMQVTNVTNAYAQQLTAPSDFSRSCVETRAGFILLGLLIGLEVLMCFAAAMGYWLEQNVWKQRKVGGIEMGRVIVTAKQP